MTRFGLAFVCTGQTEEHGTDKEISDPRLKHVLFKLLITCSLINKIKEESTKMIKSLRIGILILSCTPVVWYDVFAIWPWLNLHINFCFRKLESETYPYCAISLQVHPHTILRAICLLSSPCVAVCFLVPGSSIICYCITKQNWKSDLRFQCRQNRHWLMKS